MPAASERPAASPPELAAAALARAVFAVFPCRPGAKVPATPRGFLDATTELAQVLEWWRRNPYFNIGLAIPAGLFVLDLDLYRAPSLLAELRARDVILPATSTTETPSGGLHLWLRHPPGSPPPQAVNAAGVVGLDVRAAGKGYVLAPPSVVGGRPYVARVPLSLDRIADAPAALLDLLTTPAPASTAPSAARATGAPLPFARPRVDPMQLLIDGASEGGRYDTLWRACCALRRIGAPLAVLTEYAETVAARCSPPLPLAEARHAAKMAAGYDPTPEAVR